MKNTIQLINKRPYSLIEPFENELIFETNLNYLFDLDYLRLLDLTGEKSRDFLQGQVSCNVFDVNEEHIRQGVMCNLKGRILALLDIIQWHGLQLILPSDLMTDTQQSLSKVAMLSRVSLKENPEYRVLGFYHQNANDLLPISALLPSEKLTCIQNDYFCYHLGEGFYMLIVTEEVAKSLMDTYGEKQQLKGSLAWHHLRLYYGSIEIYPCSRGEFLPHRLSLQHTGHLDFNKGCYKGQEIIARTHFKAKLKHQLKIISLKSKDEPYATSKLYAPISGKEVGEVIDYSPIDENNYLIAASILIEHDDNQGYQLKIG